METTFAQLGSENEGPRANGLQARQQCFRRRRPMQQAARAFAKQLASEMQYSLEKQ